MCAAEPQPYAETAMLSLRLRLQSSATTSELHSYAIISTITRIGHTSSTSSTRAIGSSGSTATPAAAAA